MELHFFPQRSAAPIAVSRAGDVLTINGDAHDFSGIGEGETLPVSAIASDWIVGDVERIGGILKVPMVLPHGPFAPAQTLFPSPILLIADGNVSLPDFAGEV